MSDVFGIALSGLKAAETRIATSAYNVANISTQDARAKEATGRTLGDGGVIVDVTDRNPATVQVPSPDGSGDVQNLPNVSLDQEVATQVNAKSEFQANLKVMQAQRKLDEALFDIQA